jgi:hypothetical protein
MSIQGIILSSNFDDNLNLKLVIRNAKTLKVETISPDDDFSAGQIKLHLMDKLKYYDEIIDIAQEVNRNIREENVLIKQRNAIQFRLNKFSNVVYEANLNSAYMKPFRFEDKSTDTSLDDEDWDADDDLRKINEERSRKRIKLDNACLFNVGYVDRQKTNFIFRGNRIVGVRKNVEKIKKTGYTQTEKH